MPGYIWHDECGVPEYAAEWLLSTRLPGLSPRNASGRRAHGAVPPIIGNRHALACRSCPETNRVSQSLPRCDGVLRIGAVSMCMQSLNRLILVLWLAATLFVSRDSVVAQGRVAGGSPCSDWSEPTVFVDLQAGDASGSVLYPSLLQDSGGNLHALWSASVRKDATTDLWYSKRTGSDWSPPIDVIASPDGRAVLPVYAFDDGDWLHAYWPSNAGGLWYSRAHATALGSARGWSRPQQVFGQGHIWSTIAMAIDPAGHMSIAYASGYNTIRYLLLDRDGTTVLRSVLVYTEPDAATWAGTPSLARADDGTLWLAWKETDTTLRSKGIMYASSADGGETWSDPVWLVQGYYGGGFAGVGGALFRWYGGGVGTGTRYVSVSQDNGRNWTEPYNISLGKVASEGMQGMSFAQDSSGLWHVLEQTDNTFATVRWDGTSWSSPVPVVPGTEIGKIAGPVQNGVMTISDGNTMHAFWQAGGPSWNRQLWFTSCVLDAPAIPAQAVPPPSGASAEPAAQQSAGESGASTNAASPSSVPGFGVSETMGFTSGLQGLLVTALTPVFGLLCLVIGIYWRRARR